MTIWMVGAGIVASRATRLLAHHDVVQHDPRSEPTPPAQPGDVALLAHPAAHAPLAEAFLVRGASVVTVGDGLEDIRNLLEIGQTAHDNDATLLIGAGLTPGLSGLLARLLVEDMASADEIHVAMHGTAGPACARDHHRSLSGRAVSWWDGQWRYTLGGSGRELCWFPEPIGALDCYHAEIASPVLLHESFPEVQRIDVRRSARRRDRFTARLPMLRPPHREGAVGGLRVEVRGADADGGRVTRVFGVAELVGTASAVVAAVFTEVAADGQLPTGRVLAGDHTLDTIDLLRRVEAAGVRLQEFTGVPTRSG